MAGHEREVSSQGGHNYQGVHVYGKAQLGDTYYFGLDSPLNHLPYAVDAPFDSYHRQHEPTCLENTRVDVLRRIFDWVDGQDEQCIFWLNGLAGTGKSTIARTVAREYSERKRLGASFFFSRGGGDVSHAGKFFTSIAVQLANNAPPLQHYICEAIKERSDIASKPLRDQWRQLVLGPLSKLNGNYYQSSYVLVVDALDECDDENNIRTVLDILAEVRSLETVRLRILITSRPEVPIRHGFCHIPEAEHKDFVLHNISLAIVDHDISIFLEYNLKVIKQERALDAGWPGEEVIKRLVQSASGLFLWAATACRFIREGKRFATKRLAMILEGSSTSVIGPKKHLNEIYITVLSHSVSNNYTDEEREELYSMLRHILGCIVILFSPLSADSLSTLLHATKEDVDQTLEDLYAILDIPEDRTRPIRLHHPSFRDFLLDKTRCGDPKFWVDKKQAHLTLANSCIRRMSNLKQDICSVDAPSTLVDNIASSRVEQCISLEIQYACLYWVQHLQKSGEQLYDDDQVHRFLQVHLLHWLEALSWMRETSEAINAITSLESTALTCDCPRLYAFIHDAKRFALYSRQVIEQAPLQIYCSALIFAPAMSIVRKQFEHWVPRWMQRLPRVQEDWSALLQILKGHVGGINSVAFSSDGKLLASASEDSTVRLWDPATGAALKTLEGHKNTVNSVTFSYDGALLASASHDSTVRLWDPATGAALKTLEGHEKIVQSVAFSHDGALLASASYDNTIRLWDPATGAALKTLKGDEKTVYSVAFSHDGALLASASYDGAIIRLWDPATGAALKTLKGHTGVVSSIAFSRDSTLLASASWDKTVRLWDPATGKALKILEGSTNWVSSVAFSPDSTLLASSSWDRIIRLWDPATGAALKNLEGHGSLVNSVAFSSDSKLLASASADGAVTLWDTGAGVVVQPLEGHTGRVYSVTFSYNSMLLASASADRTVRLWDATTGAALKILKGHTGWVSSVVFFDNGTLLASASGDETVRLWDTASGAVLRTLKGHIGPVYSVACSPDGALLASTSYDKTVRLWDTATGIALKTLKGHTGPVKSVAFSGDGVLLASASHDDHTVRLWDAATGAALKTIILNSFVDTLSFSSDGPFLETDRGLLPLESHYPSDISPQAVPRTPVFLDGNWVVRNSEKLLWLPPEHCGMCSAFKGDILALGHEDGRVTVMEFG